MRSWIQRPTRGECAASSWWWMEVGLAIDWFVPLWNQTARHAVAWHNRQTSPLVSWQMLTLARSLARCIARRRTSSRTGGAVAATVGTCMLLTTLLLTFHTASSATLTLCCGAHGVRSDRTELIWTSLCTEFMQLNWHFTSV